MKPEERMREFAEIGTQGRLGQEPDAILALDDDMRAVANLIERPADVRRLAYMAEAPRMRLIAGVIEAARIVVADADRPQEGHLRDMLARLDAYDGDEQ